jgi:hypothetical protein
MTPIEQMLSAVAIDWPETPDLASKVLPHLDRSLDPAPAGLSDHSERGRRRLAIRRPLAIALAALLLMAATAAAIPGIREPVLDWLGLRSVRIERVPRPLPQPKPAPGADLDLGTHVTLAAARRRLDFEPLLPSGLGDPVVYYGSSIPGGRLGLVYRGGKLFLVEFIGTTDAQYLGKFVTPETKLERLRINGERALWIHGGLDQYVYEDRTGTIRPEQIRIVPAGTEPGPDEMHTLATVRAVQYLGAFVRVRAETDAGARLVVDAPTATGIGTDLAAGRRCTLAWRAENVRAVGDLRSTNTRGEG